MTEQGAVEIPRRSAPAYGVEVWGWGLWTGIGLWAAGFFFLPWWAALFVWWWPSMLTGAAVGLVAVWLAARLPPRRTGRRRGEGRPRG